MPLIHPFTHTFTHQRRLAAMQGTNQLVRSNWGLGVLLKDTTRQGGIELATLRLPDDSSYLLSYIAPQYLIKLAYSKSAQNNDQRSDGEQTGRLEYKYTRILNILRGSWDVRRD